MLAHGYRRFLPTKDHVFILDYVGTLFFLKNALVSSTLGQIQWKRACRYVVLCRGAKDVSRGTLGAENPPQWSRVASPLGGLKAIHFSIIYLIFACFFFFFLVL